MGYRSDVGIAIVKEVFEKLSQEEKNSFFSIFDSPKSDGKVVYFYRDWLKWYDDYEDVRSVESVLSKLEWEEYGFVRIGEDTSDVETRGDIYTLSIYPIRCINLPPKLERYIC